MTFIKCYLLVGLVLTIYNMIKMPKMSFGKFIFLTVFTVPFAPILQVVDTGKKIKKLLK